LATTCRQSVFARAAIVVVLVGLHELERDTRGQAALVAHPVAAITNLTVDATSKSTGKTTSSTMRLLRTKGDANPSPDAQAVDAPHD
jgi:hypothetical protein